MRALALGCILILGACAAGQVADTDDPAGEETLAEADSAAYAARLDRVGFEGRAATMQGVFLTWHQLELRSDRTLGQVLERATSLVVRGADGRIHNPRQSRGRAGCPVAIWLDGRRAESSEVVGMPVVDLLGVEVYRGPSEVPASFASGRRGSTCGALVIWTRDGF